MSASKISSERIGNSFDSWQSVTFFDRPRLIVRWALLLLSITPHLNHAAFWLHNWPGSEKPDLFHKKLKKSWNWVRMHLPVSHLGNVIHLARNKLLVSCLFAAKQQHFDKLRKFDRHHRPHVYQ
jgi:hypothetical protein